MEKKLKKDFIITEALPRWVKHSHVSSGGIIFDFFYFKVRISSNGRNFTTTKYRNALLGSLYFLIKQWQESDPYQMIKSKIGKVELEEAKKSFDEITRKLNAGYSGSPRRKPIRIHRILKVFREHEDELITLEALSKEFEGKADPKKSASSAIGWLNKALKESEFEIERVSAYRLRRRTRK